jgi:hypothetical protein
MIKKSAANKHTDGTQNIVRNPVPSSTELIAMANLEWKNREERRGIHNKEDWCCGWMAGFLSEKKPNWGKEQIVAAEKRGYERALDDLGVLHGEDARKFNEDDVHWITGAELREIYADDLSLDKCQLPRPKGRGL